LDSPVNVVKAVESFDSWRTPWEFYASVSAVPTLDDADRHWLERIWTAACDRTIWLSADSLAAGAAAAETILDERFPWLSALACRQLARAASYQWR
jgi:hypothetical protein